MNITNTMCRISDLTPVQKHNLIAAIPKSEYFQWSFNEGLIGFDDDGDSGTWAGRDNTKIVTYTEMMQLLGKTMKEFTKSDLKTGMFVKHRAGDYKIVTEQGVSNVSCHVHYDAFSEDLLRLGGSPESDIMSVYKTSKSRCLAAHLDGVDLFLIWERTEQTPAQKEMEVLQAKMDELQEQMKVVQAKL
jgi:hypothetical protein